MKEELKEVKDLFLVYKDKRKELEEAKMNFCDGINVENLNVVVLELCDVDVYNTYDLAVKFYGEYDYVWSLASELRKAHPRYQDAHFKSALADMIIEHNKIDEADYSKAVEVVDAYMLFEGNDFSNVHDLDVAVSELTEKIVANGNVVVDEAVGKVTDFGKKVGEGVVNVLKPYGEVAKGQYTEASTAIKEKAKDVANKGVKSLKKVLDKIDSNINK